MKNSQEFKLVQKDIAHLYSMHLVTIRTEYKILSLAHHTHTAAVFSFSCMLVLSCTAVIDFFVCTLYFVFFIVFLDLMLCVFSNSASGLQICYNKVELS